MQLITYAALQYGAMHHEYYLPYCYQENTLMNTVTYENLNKLGKGSYDTLKGFYVLNNKIAEQIVEQQMALISLNVEFITRQMKLASEAKGYKEILSGQTDITTNISSKMQGIARNTLDIFNESREELNAWFENCVRETEKGIKEATKIMPVTTTKAAA